jgi:hypothetical protein
MVEHPAGYKLLLAQKENSRRRLLLPSQEENFQYYAEKLRNEIQALRRRGAQLIREATRIVYGAEETQKQFRKD